MTILIYGNIHKAQTKTLLKQFVAVRNSGTWDLSIIRNHIFEL